MAIDYFDQKRILMHFHQLEDAKAPVSVSIDPTNLCNHDCNFCYYAGYKKKVPESMSATVLVDVVRQCITMGVKSILFTGGGEPFMNKHLPDIIKSYGNKIDMAVTTNGALITPEIAAKILPNLKY